MKKWYTNILKGLRLLGSRVYFYDPDGLFQEKNLKNELHLKYKVHEFQNEGALHIFLSQHKENVIVLHSEENLQRDFIDRQFEKFKYSLKDLFPDLDHDYIKNLDISYLQKLFTEYENRKK